MKTFTKFAVIVAAGIAAATPLLVNAAAARNPDKANRPGLRPLAPKRAVVQPRVAKRLGLTEEQKSALKEDRKEARVELKGIRNDASITLEEKRAKALELRQATRKELRSELTAEQKAELKQVRKGLRLQQQKVRRGAV